VDKATQFTTLNLQSDRQIALKTLFTSTLSQVENGDDERLKWIMASSTVENMMAHMKARWFSQPKTKQAGTLYPGKPANPIMEPKATMNALDLRTNEDCMYT